MVPSLFAEYHLRECLSMADADGRTGASHRAHWVQRACPRNKTPGAAIRAQRSICSPITQLAASRLPSLGRSYELGSGTRLVVL
jgi:hypothetical protein